MLTARSPVRIRLQEVHHKINVVIKCYLIACSSPLLVARLSHRNLIEAKGEHVSIGKRIIGRRQILGITQQELAESLGVTPQHISAIEQDKGAPSLALLPKLGEELGVSIDYLVSGREWIITDTVAAIKGDKRLELKVKRALITLVEKMREPAGSEQP